MSFKKEMCNSLYQTHTNVLSLINLARMSSTDTFKTDSQGLSQQCATIKLIHTNGCIVSKPKGQRGHHMENCIFFFMTFIQIVESLECMPIHHMSRETNEYFVKQL